MAQVVVISSFISHGAVGMAASTAALRALGHDVIQIPTVMLSNHPGYLRTAGLAMPPARLADMIDALDANRMFDGTAAILTGYLPSSRHVAAARDAVRRIRRRNPDVLYVCDPILGDDPRGLYIAESAARAIARHLIGMAEVVTPNRFELSWLTGLDVSSLEQAGAAAHTLQKSGPAAVAATSVPAGRDMLATHITSPHGSYCGQIKRLKKVPHGTGDLFAGLLTGFLITAHGPAEAAERSHAILADVVRLSAGRDILDLSPLTRIRAMP